MKLISVIMMILCIFLTASEAQSAQTSNISDRMYNATMTLPKPWYSPKSKRPETQDERKLRIRLITDVIKNETRNSSKLGWYWSDDDLAWAVFVKTWSESGRFRYSVHSGNWRGDSGRSVCLGQIMNGGNSLVGTSREPTEKCIKTVVKYLIMHQNRCLKPTSKPSVWTMGTVFSGYGTGYSCSPNVYKRVTTRSGVRKIYWARQRGWMWWRLRSS